MIIISDSSPLIALAILDKLILLEQLFTEIYVPLAVFEEVTETDKPFTRELSGFLNGKIKNLTVRTAADILLCDIGRGEADSIALAIELKSDLLLVDDLKARRFAKINGLEIIGTLGILLLAKKRKLLDQIKPLLNHLIENNIRISEKLIAMTLKAAGE